jgi:hypothetical protein
MRSCKKCNAKPRVRLELYCHDCRKVIISQLEACGYLCDPKAVKTVINEEKDRSQLNWHTLGGAVERGSDGDDW